MSKKFPTYQFPEPWHIVFGLVERHGIWLVFGLDKNGKTWLSLKLAEAFSKLMGGRRTLYVSAEEGVSMNLKDTAMRAKLDLSNRNLLFIGYESIPDLRIRLKRRNKPRIVFLDNSTVYQDELKNGELKQISDDHPDVLFVVVAHEDENKKGQPYLSVAKMAKKLAKIIIHVQGLACFVGGRCPGGQLTIDEEKACLYHGMQITNPKKKKHE
ncbi:MAG: hypothetical protein AAF717_00155 [Bacteroidota bacterium]